MYADFSKCRIAIIGDVMLDTYVDGAVQRISPEAPVPVLKFHAERFVPGGAANVAANVAGLGGQTRLVGLVGEDGQATQLLALLGQHASLDASALLAAAGHPTITKTRVLSDRQQIVRIDREQPWVLDAATRAQLIERARAAVHWADIVVLSDYGKGVLGEAVIRAVIDAAKAAGKPTIVDPKRADVEIYAGASFISPNRNELALATGLPVDSDTQIAVAAGRMIERTDSALIVTRSADGMSYFARGMEPFHLPTFAREVFDVSGAGDTVVAALAVSLGAGLPVPEAMRIANIAAGIVVGKVGTAVASAAELNTELARTAHAETAIKGQLLGLADAVALRERWRHDGLTVGFTNGCFDLLHPGHIALLEQAAAQCDRLVVALNTDASVAKLKGPTRPVQSEAARARVMGALASVDLVILFGEDTPLEAIQALKPDVLVKGADYSVETVVGAKEVIGWGGRVFLADLVAGQSTSNLVKRARTDSQP
ncbi:MAG TPA: D-glycero-beta-D-manno-heptose-7-phosphate kinase [Stellaceae bacterium]|nr:D-glycero-beta-D-manno-heptose-7-phosphate kinase [Stellaceae bacterium]